MKPAAKIATQASAIVNIFAPGSRRAISEPSTSIIAIRI